MDRLSFFFSTFSLNDWIVDIVLVLIVLLFAILGARKGMILTLFSLISIVLGLLGGRYVADLLTPPLVKQAAPMLEGIVEEYITAFLTSADAAAQGNGLLWNLLRRLMEEGLSTAEPVAAELAAALAEAIIHPLLFLLAFLLILIVCWFIAHALDLVARLPVLNTLNSLGGFVLGLLKGALLVIVLIPLLLHFVEARIPAPLLESSRILSYIHQLPHFF